MLIDQLCHVLVAGGDQRIDPLIGCLLRQRANDIIGFHSRNAQQGQSHGLDNFMYGVNLLRQFFWHGWTMGLVVGIEIIAKGLALGIKHHGNMFGIIIRQQAPNHVHDSVDGPGGFTV